MVASKTARSCIQRQVTVVAAEAIKASSSPLSQIEDDPILVDFPFNYMQ